ncbi:hypothetical protein AKJ66_00205 [candidate division MSBL1 archaeon SCGC-AAA259E22]|uniref:Uncharacterized protein n=1 Tax=candidate division MSBL1 archaeon SCGC-AAA259E22 TaxID=1698265 RepID=A0A133UII3_9EURY|nr:hypothetical protein AKJ66_00205 [candidate division MSBL1 archaeon SCGC-AAA259E22]
METAGTKSARRNAESGSDLNTYLTVFGASPRKAEIVTFSLKAFLKDLGLAWVSLLSGGWIREDGQRMQEGGDLLKDMELPGSPDPRDDPHPPRSVIGALLLKIYFGVGYDRIEANLKGMREFFWASSILPAISSIYPSSFEILSFNVSRPSKKSFTALISRSFNHCLPLLVQRFLSLYSTPLLRS